MLLDEVRARIHRLNYNICAIALRFLYRQVLKITEPWLTDVASVRQGKRLPRMWTVAEMRAALARIPGRTGLMLRRRYGSGLRLMECV